MKKLLMIMLASFALTACGDGTNRSEANQDAEENYDNTTPSAPADEDVRNEGDMSADTLNTNMGDTTSTSTQTAP